MSQSMKGGFLRDDTTGALVVTDPNAVPITLYDAKGDILVGSADNAAVRKAVGTDGQVLTADAASAGGVKWAAPGSSGIAPTLVDAKGDLLVGTADDTVARKSVGANGQGLVADSGAADGLAWAFQNLHIHRSGRWYTAPVTTAVNNLTPVQGRVYAMPFMVARRTTYDRIGINVKTVGPTNDVVRLGIYADDGNGAPGAKILDAGTVDSASSAVAVAATINQTLAAGLYWLVFVEQGANGVIVGGFTASVTQYMPPLGRSTGSDGNGVLSWRSASDLASGVLLDPFPAAPSDTTVCPIIWMRAA